MGQVNRTVGYLACVIEFPSAIRCKREAAGLSIPFTLGSRRAALRFGRIPVGFAAESNDWNLRPPIGAALLGDKWGSILETPAVYWAAPRCALLFGVTAGDEPHDRIIETLVELIPGWSRRLFLGLELVGDQLVVDAPPEMDVEHRPALVWIQGRTMSRPSAGIANTTLLVRENTRHYFSAEDLRRAVRFSCATHEPPLPHRLWRDARAARQHRNLRRAVIEACTAAEVSVSEWLRASLPRSGLPQDGVDAILRAADNLRRKSELASKLGLGLPSQKELDRLASVRNRSVHGGHAPPDDEVDDVLAIAERVVKSVTPDALKRPKEK